MTGKHRKRLFWSLLMAAVALVCLYLLALGSGLAGAQSTKPKYIFIFLADGAGTAHLELARLYSRHIHGERFNITERIFAEGSLGLMTTHSADQLITDSAASATALALGCKARNTAVGICADGSAPDSALEVAKKKGMGIGLVTTASVYDASPAAFGTHVNNRRLMAEIVDGYLSLQPELLLGGGRSQFIPKGRPGSLRKDRRDLIGRFKKNGYSYVSDKGRLAAAGASKVLGLFSPLDMDFEIDRDGGGQPSLSEMTASAIRILRANGGEGFVLFVENENIDSAAHFSDAASLVREYREFDHAVKLAYDFYKERPAQTLVLVVSDHETGGLLLTGGVKGVGFFGRIARVLPSKRSLERLHSIRISVGRVMRVLGQKPTAKAVDKVMAEHYAGFNLPSEIREELTKGESPGPTFYAMPTAANLGAMIAHNTQVSWSTGSHTNQPVFIGALGAGSERFRGYLDNADFGKRLIALLSE